MVSEVEGALSELAQMTYWESASLERGKLRPKPRRWPLFGHCWGETVFVAVCGGVRAPWGGVGWTSAVAPLASMLLHCRARLPSSRDFWLHVLEDSEVRLQSLHL